MPAVTDEYVEVVVRWEARGWAPSPDKAVAAVESILTCQDVDDVSMQEIKVVATRTSATRVREDGIYAPCTRCGVRQTLRDMECWPCQRAEIEVAMDVAREYEMSQSAVRMLARCLSRIDLLEVRDERVERQGHAGP